MYKEIKRCNELTNVRIESVLKIIIRLICKYERRFYGVLYFKALSK